MLEQYLLNLYPSFILIDERRVDDSGIGKVTLAHTEMRAS